MDVFGLTAYVFPPSKSLNVRNRSCGAGAPEFVVCDPGRRGRDHFLDAFGAASGLSPMFVDQAVPDGCVDVFDGTPIGAVGVLAAR